MNKKSPEKYVTQTVFVKEMTGVRQSIETLDEKFVKEMTEVRETIETLDGKFVKEMTEVRQVVGHLNKKIDGSVDRLSLAIVNNQKDIKEIKDTMATKDDIRALNASLSAQIDGLAKIVKLADQNEGILVYKIKKELEPRVDDHESRIAALEKRPPAS